MTLLLCNYPEFKIDSSWKIPSNLRDIIQKAWQIQYEELYEENADGTGLLEDYIAEILDAIWSKNDILGHHRFVLMALILTLAVEPTVKAYLPDDIRTRIVLNLLNIKQIYSAQINPSLVSEINNQLFPKNSIGSQAIDEALDVCRNAVRVIDSNQAKAALLEMLDDCFEGYAIFPGSQGRRDLFNWWLLEVV
ncbi:MAG TPA: hypothetical protein DEG17_10730, partial [Cyanobacteria bacterium UBA11149]|nr:hypothetical protein [Cyanobacteria bacterium UBA11149]